MSKRRQEGWVWASLIGVTTALVCATGCAHKRTAWTPKPLVHWEDIATGPVERPDNGYVVLVDQPTSGLFPADLAVTRVSIEAEEARNDRRYARLHPTPRNEYLQWNAAFDDLMAISEVFPIAQRDMGGGAPDPVQILSAFRALNARMGLVYALNELSEDEAEIIAALYDTARDEPIASLHTRAVSAADPKDKRRNDATYIWETDTRALVREQFEDILYTCLRQMILEDEPAAVEEPTGWRPLRPAEWPPRTVPSNP